MINRISEIPFWGPEEQIRRFVNQHDNPDDYWADTFAKLAEDGYFPDPSTSELPNQRKYDILVQSMAIDIVDADLPEDEWFPKEGSDEDKETWLAEHKAEMDVAKNDIDLKYRVSQQSITQQRIENLDEIYQKQLIWSYGLKNVDDAYFYQDWCPIGDPAIQEEPYVKNPKWQMDLWGEAAENIHRSMDRSFDYNDFQGYVKSELRRDELQVEYDASTDDHALEGEEEDNTDLDVDTLRHNIMWSYLEVSEWLGDGATAYGSQNGFVSRKMSLAWLFNAIKALINWKLANQDKWAEEDINPLEVGKWCPPDETYTDGHWEYNKDSNGNDICERFLDEHEKSTRGVEYDDYDSLDQIGGCCDPAKLKMVRAKDPVNHGTLKVRGNEWHYGERAYFYTHNSFVGECRFFHNARFLGQTTFDKEINGTAMRSRWADLAEFKEADGKYEPGTLVMFGGEREITISDGRICHAIVTTKPGLVLNSGKHKGKTMVGIALVGTVPVNVCESDIRKFDKLVPSTKFKGYARRRRWYDFFKKTIGIALSDAEGGQVQCMTKMEF